MVLKSESWQDIVDAQKSLCAQVGVNLIETHSNAIVGYSRTLIVGAPPYNGLRHPNRGNISGWYLYSGLEMSGADDFFQPLHAIHLYDKCPAILKYLGLPPGWRFLTDGTYEDIWFDECLLTSTD